MEEEMEKEKNIIIMKMKIIINILNSKVII